MPSAPLSISIPAWHHGGVCAISLTSVMYLTGDSQLLGTGQPIWQDSEGRKRAERELWDGAGKGGGLRGEEACLASGRRGREVRSGVLDTDFHSFTIQSSFGVSDANSRQPLFASEGCREEENWMLLLKLYVYLGI